MHENRQSGTLNSQFLVQQCIIYRYPTIQIKNTIICRIFRRHLSIRDLPVERKRTSRRRQPLRVRGSATDIRLSRSTPIHCRYSATARGTNTDTRDQKKIYESSIRHSLSDEKKKKEKKSSRILLIASIGTNLPRHRFADRIAVALEEKKTRVRLPSRIRNYIPAQFVRSWLYGDYYFLSWRKSERSGTKLNLETHGSDKKKESSNHQSFIRRASKRQCCFTLYIYFFFLIFIHSNN